MPQQRLGRSWGTRFDSLTSSDSFSSNPESAVASSHHASSPPHSVSADDGGSVQDTHDRIFQDASIFVGSLPANIEHSELANMLIQHLSDHPQIKGIKVVRDSKGGTCAFIQCQDPEAASILINNLHVTAPQPFLGRYLRYEPARAFRTLLISYRSPSQYVRPRDSLKKGNFVSSEDPRFVEVRLPTAMRIMKTPGTKQLTILWDSESLKPTITGGTDSGLSLVPLLYDAESLLRIASVFGVVECFGPYADEIENGQVSANFPAPHDGPRSPVMDPGCWKIKWAHRDDCVSALVTLRRVPHLTVTWAHQSNTPHAHNPRAFPGFQSSHSWRGRGAGPTRFRLPASHTFPVLRAKEPSPVEHPLDVKEVVDSGPGYNVWQHEISVPDNRSVLPSRPSRPRALSLTHDRPQSEASLPSRESTGQLSFTTWESANRGRWAGHAGSTEFAGGSSVTMPNHTSSPYLDSQIVSSDSGYCTSPLQGDNQEIDAGGPPTPDFGTSPVTPKTPGSFMLRTPTTTSYMGDFQSISCGEHDSQSSLPQLLPEKRDDHVVDPTSIFVGGLEMFGPNAWDEDKVRALFSKYGGIEAVKVIRPSSKRSAFAFVKFNNTEAPARAIKAEHNRVLDGRLIRVQLRDWNPAYRPFWRPGPNRDTGSPPLNPANDSNADTRLPGPSVVDTVATHIADLRVSDTQTQPTHRSSGETCSLNEVQDAEIPILSCDDPECGSAKELHVRKTERLFDAKHSGRPSDTTLAPAQVSTTPAQALLGPYPTPTIQFYQGWIPSYTPQFPYQIPFPGQPYSGYPFPPHVVPPPPQSGGSDGSGTPTHMPPGPNSGTYPTFIPHPPPFVHGPDTGQSTVSQLGVSSNPTLLHAQAPLIPTGFIQGDQGMLVPVYPPDALNQYMTGIQDHSQGHTNSGSSEGQPPVAWRSPYPPPPIRPQAVIFHPYINPPLAAPPPHHPAAHAWIPGHAWHGVTPQLGNPQGIPGRRILSSLTGGPAPVPMGERNLIPPRRQYRRDNHHQHHKNSFVRGPANGRFGKTSFDASRAPSDVQSAPALQGAIPDTSADANWQRWSAEQGNPV